MILLWGQTGLCQALGPGGYCCCEFAETAALAAFWLIVWACSQRHALELL